MDGKLFAGDDQEVEEDLRALLLELGLAQQDQVLPGASDVSLAAVLREEHLAEALEPVGGISVRLALAFNQFKVHLLQFFLVGALWLFGDEQLIATQAEA